MIARTATAPDRAAPERRLLARGPGARALLGSSVGLAFLAAAVVIGQAYLVSVVVADVFLGSGTLATVALPLGVVAILAVVRAPLLLGGDVLAQTAAARVKGGLRADLTAHLLALGPAYTRRHPTGELTGVVVDGMDAIDAYLTSFRPARALAVAVPLLVLGAVLVVDPPTTLVLLATGPVLVLLLAVIGGRTRAISERRDAEVRWLGSFFLDMLQGIATLKMFGRSAEQVGNIRAISRQYGDTTMEVLRTAFQTSLVLEWGGAVAVALVAVEISLRLMAGSIEFSRALAVLIIVPEFFLPLRALATRYHAGAAGRVAAARAFAILDVPLAPGSGLDAHRGRRRLATSPSTPTSCSRVSPSPTPTARNRRFVDLSLVIPHGRVVALAGQTGAGKSTVANLLLRFIEPDAGEIRVGDRRLDALDVASWRATVAWVPQLPYLFHGSIADNVRLARPDADDDAVRDAVREAGADRVRRCLAPWPRHAGRRGWQPAQRRPAPADRDRPGDPCRCPPGHPRRGHLAARRGERGGHRRDDPEADAAADRPRRLASPAARRGR